MNNTIDPTLDSFKYISPNSPQLQYSGRIDFTKETAPIFIYPYSSIETIFTGTTIKILVSNWHQYWNNYLGYIIDGKQEKVLLPKSSKPVTITLAENLEDKEHTLFLFKRMDACHHFIFYGLLLDKEATVKSVQGKPRRRMEFYGDSVTAGEVSEAEEYVNKADPEHQGEYSNSWYSYATMTARRLNAQIHNIAQGGIALLDDTGWFGGENYVGLESTYDKLSYNTSIAPALKWDFSKYTPHVVVVAIGQNDSNPKDYMKEDYYGKEAEYWRFKYQEFIEKLREIYPTAIIILSTTILNHHPSWDRAIAEVCDKLNDSKIHHFLYSKNGRGTPGHIRISEASKMSCELSKYIESLGEEIWNT